MKKILRYSCLILFFAIIFSSCSSKDAEQNVKEIIDNVNDQLENVNDASDKHVVLVKNAYLQGYPKCKYGDVFDNFFGEPTWKYFQADDGTDVVEFTGYFTYLEKKVKAGLQFILDMEDNSFKPGHLSFNEVPQSNLITVSLISKAFTVYMDKYNIEIGYYTDDGSEYIILNGAFTQEPYPYGGFEGTYQKMEDGIES